MDIRLRYALCLVILLWAQVVINQNLILAKVLNEGCIDETCLKYLMRDSRRVNKCFDPLRASITLDDYTGLNMCCAVQKYQICIFPLIITNCGLDSMDKFEAEMRSMNAICELTTLSWAKCEPKNQTLSEEAQAELREVNK